MVVSPEHVAGPAPSLAAVILLLDQLAAMLLSFLSLPSAFCWPQRLASAGMLVEELSLQLDTEELQQSQ